MEKARFEWLTGIAGVLFFVVVFASFFTPETPDADDSTAEILNELADDRTGHIASAYLGGLASVLFVAYAAGLWSRLRSLEPGRGPSVLVPLAALGSAIMILVANGVLLAAVEAADEGREPEAVRALFELDEIIFVPIGFTTALFYAGAALSALPTGGLPRWLGWVAAVLAIVFPLALLGLFSEADEGGVLGGVFFGALLVNFLWILITSIVMVRGSSISRAGPGR
jgi:hypothetical protein